MQTWKIGLDWQVNDDFRVRGTTSVDIRAPTLNDLYTPPTQTSIGYNDILTNFGNGLEQQSQGNPNLVPEVSRTYTAGVVYTPTYIPGLTASVDFYKSTFTTRFRMSPAATCRSSRSAMLPSARRHTAPSICGPFPTRTPRPPIIRHCFTLENLNSAFVSTEGEDYEVDYHFDMADMDAIWRAWSIFAPS